MVKDAWMGGWTDGWKIRSILGEASDHTIESRCVRPGVAVRQRKGLS